MEGQKKHIPIRCLSPNMIDIDNWVEESKDHSFKDLPDDMSSDATTIGVLTSLTQIRPSTTSTWNRSPVISRQNSFQEVNGMSFQDCFNIHPELRDIYKAGGASREYFDTEIVIIPYRVLFFPLAQCRDNNTLREQDNPTINNPKWQKTLKENYITAVHDTS